MREILFRGKQRIGADQWIFGDLEHFGDHLLIYTRTGEHGFIHPDTVGQWTGQLDKNGIKIFEGDVINLDGDSWLFEVCWLDDSSQFIAYAEGGGRVFHPLFAYISEVIGNIHDNPELLKGTSEE